jgi:hypothetical protein
MGNAIYLSNRHFVPDHPIEQLAVLDSLNLRKPGHAEYFIETHFGEKGVSTTTEKSTRTREEIAAIYCGDPDIRNIYWRYLNLTLARAKDEVAEQLQPHQRKLYFDRERDAARNDLVENTLGGYLPRTELEERTESREFRAWTYEAARPYLPGDYYEFWDDKQGYKDKLNAIDLNDPDELYLFVRNLLGITVTRAEIDHLMTDDTRDKILDLTAECRTDFVEFQKYQTVDDDGSFISQMRKWNPYAFWDGNVWDRLDGRHIDSEGDVRKASAIMRGLFRFHGSNRKLLYKDPRNGDMRVRVEKYPQMKNLREANELCDYTDYQLEVILEAPIRGIDKLFLIVDFDKEMEERDQQEILNNLHALYARDFELRRRSFKQRRRPL